MESSDRMLAAMAALMGAATFALMSDIASRSGNSAACWASSSSLVSSGWGTGFGSSAIWGPPICVKGGGRYSRRPWLVSGTLVDRRVLHGVRVGSRAVGEHVSGHRGIDGHGDVRIDQRHRLAIGQFRRLLLELLV